MKQEEKDKLLSLFAKEQSWCQGVEARDDQGNPARYGDERAAAWDLVGGLCYLFGWSRACKLFVQVVRHIAGSSRRWTSQDREMAAMRTLQDFNDRGDMTYEEVMERLRALPVWAPSRAKRLGH